MVNTVISNPIDAATSSIAAQERALLSEIRNAVRNAPPDALFGGVHIYNIDVDFDQFLASQIDLEREVKNIPTLWTISEKELGELDQAARLLLHQHPCFQQLLLDLDQSASFIDPTFAGNGCPQPQPSEAASAETGFPEGPRKAGLVRNSGRPPTDAGHRGG
jgi:hypothetical protein